MSAATKEPKGGILLGNKWRSLDLSEPKEVDKKDDTGEILRQFISYMIR
jgi:hypothetical protein